MASDKYECAKKDAMTGYLDPGPGHLNCAQSVLHCSLRATDRDPALTNVANYLGGGVARTGQICGALSGAAVALGVHDLRDTAADTKDTSGTMDWVQQLNRRFEARFGATSCKDLLGCDISTPEGFREAKRTQATKRCPEFVGWACDQLAELLDRE